MNVQESKNMKSTNRITIILVVAVTATAVGIVGALYASGTAMVLNGSEHSSNSLFSPLINKDNSKPEADPFTSLAKHIEAHPIVTKQHSQEYTGGY